MNEQLLKALKLALKNKGLNEGLSKFITVEKEEEIDGAITEYLTLAPPSTLTPAQILEQAEVKAELDRRITAAVKTNTDNLAKRHNFDPTKEPTPQTPPGPADPNQALLDAIAKLTLKVETIEAGKTIEVKKADAVKKLGTSTVLPEKYRQKWEHRIDVNSETAIEDQIKALEEEYTDLMQDVADDTGYSKKPGSGGTKQEATAEEAGAIIGNPLA